MDRETGLYYHGARYFDPRTSVWQSPDPILASYLPTGDKKKDKKLPGNGGVYNSRNLNLFSYTSQNPTKYIDPDGKTAILPPEPDSSVPYITANERIQFSNYRVNIRISVYTIVTRYSHRRITFHFALSSNPIGINESAVLLRYSDNLSDSRTGQQMGGGGMTSGGRSGQNIKYLVGKPNSVYKGTSNGRVYVTDHKGRVVLDIARSNKSPTGWRVKHIVPGKGIIRKRYKLTQGEKNISDLMWKGYSQDKRGRILLPWKPPRKLHN